MVSTVSLTLKKQLDDKWAAAFYECGIPWKLQVHKRSAMQLKTRLGWCACPTIGLHCL
jgi:hypothetical protein